VLTQKLLNAGVPKIQCILTQCIQYGFVIAKRAMYLIKDDIHAFLHTITVTTCKVVYVMLCVATLAITCTDYNDWGLQYNIIPLCETLGI